MHPAEGELSLFFGTVPNVPVAAAARSVRAEGLTTTARVRGLQKMMADEPPCLGALKQPRVA